MPICDICGEEEDIVTKCKNCGKLFCEFCGSSDDRLCIDCLDDEDDDGLDADNWL